MNQIAVEYFMVDKETDSEIDESRIPKRYDTMASCSGEQAVWAEDYVPPPPYARPSSRGASANWSHWNPPPPASPSTPSLSPVNIAHEMMRLGPLPGTTPAGTNPRRTPPNAGWELAPEQSKYATEAMQRVVSLEAARVEQERKLRTSQHKSLSASPQLYAADTRPSRATHYQPVDEPRLGWICGWEECICIRPRRKPRSREDEAIPELIPPGEAQPQSPPRVPPRRRSLFAGEEC